MNSDEKLVVRTKRTTHSETSFRNADSGMDGHRKNWDGAPESRGNM